MTNPVYGFGYAHTCKPLTGPFGVTHPLARRMSPLQKVLLEVSGQWKEHHKELFEEALVKRQAQILFATSFGEMESVLNVLTSILNNQLPVSPTAFQHSVHNCAPGYFSIVNGLRNAAVTASTGFLSLDKCLHAAFQKIRAGVLDSVFVIAADERHKEVQPFVEGECLLLTSKLSDAALLVAQNESLTAGNFVPVAFELLECTYFHEPGTDLLPQAQAVALRHQALNSEVTLETQEREGTQALLRFGTTKRESFVRRVTNLDGESVVSVWKKFEL